jgi:MFS family permease
MGNQQAVTGIFQIRDYRYLTIAQVISSLGDWLDYLALLALVGLKWNASPMAIGFCIFAFAAPAVLLGPVAGALADRMERKTLMIVSDLVRAGLVLSIVSVTSIWQLYVILALKGAFEAIFTPAKNGKLKEILPDEYMEKATSISTVIDQGSKIIGPMISGVLVAAFSINAAFYIDAISFLCSALLLTQVSRWASKGKSGEGAEGMWQQLVEGSRFIRKDAVLWYGTLVLGAILLAVMVVDSQLTVLLRQIPHMSPTFIATAMAASGIGMILGAGVLSQRSTRSVMVALGSGSIAIGVVYGSAAGFTHVSISVAWATLPVLFLVGGVFAALVFIPFQAAMQMRTPVEFTGRVFGTLNSVMTLSTILGPVVGGILVTTGGVVGAFIGCGVALVILGLFILAMRNKIEPRDANVAESDGRTQAAAEA